MRILIVDDDIVTRKLLHIILMNYGLCDLAVDGTQAVEFVSRACEQQNNYDVIFLDILMPELDGHDTLKIIRKIEESHKIFVGDGAKIVMQTCLDDQRSILSSFREGCEYYIVKPYSKTKIMDLLHQIKKAG